jgi:hypothetical protein
MRSLLLAPLLASCGMIHGSYRTCDPPARTDWPATLSMTGLYNPDGTLAPGVTAYQPAFELWADGASKRRWIFLPAGATIDRSDPDAWRFPVGTKLWKEFSIAGVRVETRLLEKVGPADEDWRAIAYLARADQRDADPAPDGVEGALGTSHRVPAAKDCFGCHGGTRSRVLGYSAVQLEATLPGDPETRALLGDLHANCGHCHNQHRPPARGARCYDPRTDFDLSLRVGQLGRVEDTPFVRTALATLVTPGDPDGSLILRRRSRSSVFRPRMPPLGSQQLDLAALQRLRGWIARRAGPTRAR